MAAQTCARLGAHVLLLNRPSPRADAALALVSQNAPGGATAVECDLQSFASVRAAAEKVKQLCGASGLDVLCCNAGVMALKDEATADGYDVQMQSNHLSHFLLSRELFPLLEKAAALRGEARIVNHSSGARNVPPGQLSAAYLGKNGGRLGGNGASMFFGGARWQRYHQTKLANAVFTLALAAKLAAAGSKVKCLCAAPGLAATNLQVTTAADGGFGASWIMRYAQSSEDGTMPLLTCMLAADAPNGGFYEPEGLTAMAGKPVRKDLAKEGLCSSAKAQKMLWEESEKACGAWTF